MTSPKHIGRRPASTTAVESGMRSAFSLLPRLGGVMTKAFVEPAKGGGYQIEFIGSDPHKERFSTQGAAIEAAKRMGHKPLVALVRELNDKSKPDQWRSV